jgi:hypothetical protein
MGVLSAYFWPAVGIIYIGFVALAADAWVEPEFSKLTRFLTCALVLAIGGVFTRYVVFSDAKVEFNVMAESAGYVAGSEVGGIQWRPEFTAVTINVMNNSDVDYNDLSLNIKATEPTVGIGQMSTIPNCFFQAQAPDHMDLNVLPVALRVQAEKLSLIANEAGYKLHCVTLPAHTTIEIVAATADIRQDTSGDPLDKNYLIRTKNADDFSSEWYGRPGGDYYIHGQFPGYVVITGSYVAVWKPRAVYVKFQMNAMPGPTNVTVYLGKPQRSQHALIAASKISSFSRLLYRNSNSAT